MSAILDEVRDEYGNVERRMVNVNNAEDRLAYREALEAAQLERDLLSGKKRTYTSVYSDEEGFSDDDYDSLDDFIDDSEDKMAQRCRQEHDRARSRPRNGGLDRERQSGGRMGDRRRDHPLSRERPDERPSKHRRIAPARSVPLAVARRGNPPIDRENKIGGRLKEAPATEPAKAVVSKTDEKLLSRYGTHGTGKMKSQQSEKGKAKQKIQGQGSSVAGSPMSKPSEGKQAVSPRLSPHTPSGSTKGAVVMKRPPVRIGFATDEGSKETTTKENGGKMDLSMYLRKKAVEAKREASQLKHQQEVKISKRTVATDDVVVPKKKKPDAVALQTKAREIELSKKGKLVGKVPQKTGQGASKPPGVLIDRKPAPSKKYSSLDMNKLLGGGVGCALSASRSK